MFRHIIPQEVRVKWTPPHADSWIDGGRVRFWILDQNDDSWLGLIEHTPVIAGWAIVTIGLLQYKELLDHNGRAFFRLPSNIFEYLDRYHLQIHILPVPIA